MISQMAEDGDDDDADDEDEFAEVRTEESFSVDIPPRRGPCT